MLRQFVVVFTAKSNACIARKPDDPGRVLKGEFGHGDTATHSVQIADEVTVENGVSIHTHLEVGVQAAAETIDEAINFAWAEADMALAVLSASSRAAVGHLEPKVAFEYTLGLEERECVEWLGELPTLDPKKPVSLEAFAGLTNWLVGEQDLATVWRVQRSMEWHRSALLETAAARRFHHLWLSVEAAESPLADLFDVPAGQRDGQPGFGRLAAECGMSEEFKHARDLRTALFHVKRESNKQLTYDDVPSMALKLLPALETLIVRAWFRIADLPVPDGFPNVSISGSPRVVLRSTLLQADPTPWMECQHPHWKGEWSVSPGDDGAETTVTTTHSIENAEGWKELGVGIWYPPNSGEIRLSQGGDPRS